MGQNELKKILRTFIFPGRNLNYCSKTKHGHEKEKAKNSKKHNFVTISNVFFDNKLVKKAKKEFSQT